MTKEELEQAQQECPSYKKGLCMTNLFNPCRGQCDMDPNENLKKKENKTNE